MQLVLPRDVVLGRVCLVEPGEWDSRHDSALVVIGGDERRELGSWRWEWDSPAPLTSFDS